MRSGWAIAARGGWAIALAGFCGFTSSGCAGTGRSPATSPPSVDAPPVHGESPAAPPGAARGPAASASKQKSTLAGTYTVRRQDTLYGIAFRHQLDFHDLARWNHLGPDYAISVGQVLRLHAPLDADRAGDAGRAGDAARPKPAVLPRGLKWLWPTQRLSAPRRVPGGGILLFGKVGQAVRASGAGRVVYVGSGIRGYGNLIILKHGESVLSAYAHNQQLLVREGQDVGAGQQIGRMGVGPHQVAVLYFEIRLNGKPVDPLKYLPLN